MESCCTSAVRLRLIPNTHAPPWVRWRTARPPSRSSCSCSTPCRPPRRAPCILLPFKTHWLALRPAAAARPPRPAGPTTGPGVHAVGPARWQVLLVLGEDLLARSLPRYQAAGVIFSAADEHRGARGGAAAADGRHGSGASVPLRRVARRADGAGPGGRGKRRPRGVWCGVQQPLATKARGSNSAGSPRTAPPRRRFRLGFRALRRPVRPPCGVVRGFKAPPRAAGRAGGPRAWCGGRAGRRGGGATPRVSAGGRKCGGAGVLQSRAQAQRVCVLCAAVCAAHTVCCCL